MNFIYLVLIGTTLFIYIKIIFTSKPSNTGSNKKLDESVPLLSSTEIKTITTALLAGYISILLTNFFGFSVVPVALQFFLYPAAALTLSDHIPKSSKQITFSKMATLQYASIIFVLCTMFFLLFSIGKYWYSDYLYTQAKTYNDSGYPIKAHNTLQKVVAYSPHEAIYWNELAKADARIASAFYKEGNTENAKKFAAAAFTGSKKAVELSPVNVNILRDQANLMFNLSEIEINYLLRAKESLTKALKLAPTEAKIMFNTGLVEIRTGNTEKGLDLLKETVEIKPNYKDARYALALVLIDKGEKDKAREQLVYILEKLSPDDAKAKEELQNLK